MILKNKRLKILITLYKTFVKDMASAGERIYVIYITFLVLKWNNF